MDDKIQNVICHIEIKEEYSKDFIEIENQNLQINQKDKIQNNFVQYEKQSYLQTLCSIKVESNNLSDDIKTKLQDQYISSNQVEMNQKNSVEFFEMRQEISEENVQQNKTLKHFKIKEEDLDHIELQINKTDPLSVANSNIDDIKDFSVEIQTQLQPNQKQSQQLVELRVSNDKIDGQFCMSWLKDNFELASGAIISQKDMYQQYLTSMYKFFDKKDVVSSHYFSGYVR